MVEYADTIKVDDSVDWLETGGNKKKFDKVKKTRYLELLSEGIGRIKASKEVGIHIVTVERHMNKFPAFRDACSLAEMEADEEVENALFEAARSGHVAAAFGWLYNRRPEKWTDRRNVRTEISGPDGGPLQSEIAIGIVNDLIKDPESRIALEGLAKRLESNTSINGG